jgi:hypothetical protein
VIPANPAHKKPNTGKRTGRKGGERAAENAEKTITTVLGGLLIAERMATLSGRDDEFVMTLTLQHAALRLGQGVGLETCYLRPGAVRVEWQLSEVRGKQIKAIPKYGSRGTGRPGSGDFRKKFTRTGSCGAACEAVNRLLPGSGWPDLNRRPLRPERSALPSCATPRRPDARANRG